MFCKKHEDIILLSPFENKLCNNKKIDIDRVAILTFRFHQKALIRNNKKRWVWKLFSSSTTK